MTAQIIVEFDRFAAVRQVYETHHQDDAHAALLAWDIHQDLADLADDIDGNVADLLEGIVFDTPSASTQRVCSRAA